jgi:hypothetical protein
MVMMEEFRRRRNLQRYFELIKKQKQTEASAHAKKSHIMDLGDEAVTNESQYINSGPERYFTPGKDEIFDPNEFTMIFLESDSVTNVTSLNRVNHRRVLLFIGNGNGVISYGKGKGEDYEQAFDEAFKKLKQNLVCINLD